MLLSTSLGKLVAASTGVAATAAAGEAAAALALAPTPTARAVLRHAEDLAGAATLLWFRDNGWNPRAAHRPGATARLLLLLLSTLVLLPLLLLFMLGANPAGVALSAVGTGRLAACGTSTTAVTAVRSPAGPPRLVVAARCTGASS